MAPLGDRELSPQVTVERLNEGASLSVGLLAATSAMRNDSLSGLGNDHIKAPHRRHTHVGAEPGGLGVRSDGALLLHGQVSLKGLE